MHTEPLPVIHKLPNKLTAFFLVLMGSLTLLGCANNLSQQNYDLDTYTLGRSAVFTQRELINEQLKEPAEINTEVRDTLLFNYCDLVARDSIYVSSDNLPQQCKPLDSQQRQCAYDYHICIKACPLRTNDCQSCINRAKRCLAAAG